MSSEPTLSILDTEAAGGLIIRGGALRLAGYAGVVALSLIPVVLLTRYLGPERFGRYTTVISLVTVVATVTDAGMSSLATREYAMLEGVEREARMRDLLGLRMALTVLGLVAAVLFAVIAGYSEGLLAGTVIASVATIALVLQHTLSVPLAAELRLGAIAALDLARQALTVIAMVVLVLAGAGVFPLLAVTLLVYTVLVPVTARLVRGGISMRLELRPRAWMSLLRLTVSFSLATAVGAVYVYTAQILTSVVASQHQSGLFASAFRVFIVSATVPGLLVGGALPLLARSARDDRDRLAYALQRIFEVSLILGVASALGVVAGAPFILSVIAGPQYAAAAGSLRFLGLALAASFLVATWGFALVSTERYRGLLVVNGVAFLVSALLTLALAASHGATGVGVAMLCSEVTIAVGYLIVLIRERPDLRPHLRVAPKVLAAAAPAAAVLLVGGLSSLAQLTIVLAIYTAGIALTRAMPREIIELIPWHRRRSGGAGTA
jgi:O-antigen/teichoic acid export membrane protein